VAVVPFGVEAIASADCDHRPAFRGSALAVDVGRWHKLRRCVGAGNDNAFGSKGASRRGRFGLSLEGAHAQSAERVLD
jgi:hypothetical protein